MKEFIHGLKIYGIKTIASCCGHGKYSMTIIVKDVVGYYDIVSNTTIPRTRNFYRRDKQGYYYIPEVVEN